MKNIFLFFVAFSCGVTLFVSGYPCKIPSNLNTNYKKLAQVTLGKRFLRPAEYSTQSDYQTLQQDAAIIPAQHSDKIMDRSICSWYYLKVTNDTLFPPVRSEAVCRHRECIDGYHNCEAVYNDVVFLKRTALCVDGFFVYELITEPIPTSCACAQIRTKDNSAIAH